MASTRPAISKRVRLGLSFLIIGHLLAVVLPPLSLQTRGPVGQSPSVSTLLRVVEGYSQMVYIDRGYAFFAPDPGPSHLIQAEITSKEGSRVELMFPDRSEQWPRLLYHRHFMLSEFMEEIYQPPGPPESLSKTSPTQATYWIEARGRYEHVRKSVVDHLRYEHPGHEVAIRRVEHLIPDLLDYQQEPIDLTDERLYRVMLDRAASDDELRSDETSSDEAGEDQPQSRAKTGNEAAFLEAAETGGLESTTKESNSHVHRAATVGSPMSRPTLLAGDKLLLGRRARVTGEGSR
ncbi:MAG: hypothetical protein ACR2NZ_23330 [Rubripirellula sp.]